MSNSTTQASRPAEAVALYKALAEQPTVTRGSVRSDEAGHSVSIELDLSVRSHASLTRRSLRSTIVVSTASTVPKRVHLSTASTDESVKASVRSRDGKRTVVLRELPEGKGVGEERRRVVELWEGARCMREVHVGKRHGAFCTDVTFGGISLCPTSADAVLYVADAKGPLKPTPSGPLAQHSDEDHLAAYDFLPSLGEKSGSLLRPRVFLLRFNTSSKEQLEAGPALAQLSLPGALKDASHGHISFRSADSANLTVYRLLPDGRHLGIVYCTNRPAQVISVSLPAASGENTEKATKPNEPSTVAWEARNVDSLSRTQWSARSARSSHAESGSSLIVWLENEEGGAHNDCAALCMQRAEQSPKVLVPVADVPDRKLSFAGLYLDALPTAPWLSLDAKSSEPTHALLTSIHGSRRCVFMIDLASGAVLNLDFSAAKPGVSAEKEDTASYNVLATDGARRFLVVRSSLNELPHVGLVEMHDSKGAKWSWTDVWSAYEDDEDDVAYEQSGLDSISELLLSVISIPATRASADDKDVAIEAVLLRPPNAHSFERPAPCVLFPHGGPHGTTTTDWSPSVAALALAGYTIVLPNYHGSLGMGQRFAHSLLGRCGALDVQDCIATVDHLVAAGIAAADRLVVTGGSHGGFLSAHLIGQYPDKFKAAVMRNPVISSAEQAIGTDIPEWCFLEFGERFDFSAPPSHISPEVFAKLHAASPLAHVASMRTPVLLLLGRDDRRVPPQQSRTLYHALKGAGQKVRMLAFDGADHALDTIEAESVGWEAALTWFNDALVAKRE